MLGAPVLPGASGRFDTGGLTRHQRRMRGVRALRGRWALAIGGPPGLTFTGCLQTDAPVLRTNEQPLPPQRICLNDLIPDFPEVDESLVERVAAALRPASALSVISSFEHLYEVQLEQAGTTDLPEQVLAHWRDLGYDAALGDNGILVLSKRSQQREAEELALLREEEQREFAAARLQQEQAMAPTTTTLCSLRPTAEVFVPAAAVVPVFGQPQPPPLPPAAGGSLFGGSLFGGGGGNSFLGAAAPAVAAISEATPFFGRWALRRRRRRAAVSTGPFELHFLIWRREFNSREGGAGPATGVDIHSRAAAAAGL